MHHASALYEWRKCETETDKYEDAIHVVLQSLNVGLVMALRFLSVKCPECVGTTVKIAYHALFFGISVRTIMATFNPG
jgi:hypothetical protein